ncbi:MAG TPA: ABC transporter ATP-binding protein [Bacillota bacterium]|nr:ABC transporter ATP-binding protein [Bacillota bacterium]
MIAIEGVSLTYKQENTTVEVLNNISLNLGRGESWVIIGPSGCGKSSLLFLLAGLTAPSAGVVKIQGRTLSGPRQDTALILQEYGLFPWKTVGQNVALGLELRGLTLREREERIRPILEELGLSAFHHHFPGQLSGGQRQRVGVARALALAPDLLLMDEPFSSLDALTREALQELMLKIWQDKGLTTVMVTHSIEEAVFLGQKIVVFSPRPARLVEVIDNPGVGTPNYRDTADFYHNCALVRETLELGHQ